MLNTIRNGIRVTLMGSLALLVSGCADGMDFDLRNNFGNSFDTSGAVRQNVAPRPQPDSRGVISYPGYQVVVARRGDTISQIAARIGADPQKLSRYNAISADTPLRSGEIIALPDRVAEPSPATGAIGTGPIRPASDIDVETLASDAIDRAAPQTTTSRLPQTGIEPIRHRVQRGETAYSIARLYDVDVRALADWNGLGSDLSVREGQYLLIPVAEEPAPVATTRPGSGTPTPTPPSATQPLPEDDTTSPAPAPEAPPAPQVKDDSILRMPVDGRIIRPFEPGGNGGIDIAANPGTTVRAADAGTVAAVTQDTDNVAVLVIKHPDNLLTVYANIADISVSKGDTVARGQNIAVVRDSDPAFIRFEVRRGIDPVDPVPLLN